ncbi:hypothetical protein [Nocardiopsis halotolerans]|nr:hypothetical protein [Nocardiopsis halotolerans]
MCRPVLTGSRLGVRGRDLGGACLLSLPDWGVPVREPRINHLGDHEAGG